jgi:hypothetical protein
MLGDNARIFDRELPADELDHLAAELLVKLVEARLLHGDFLSRKENQNYHNSRPLASRLAKLGGRSFFVSNATGRGNAGGKPPPATEAPGGIIKLADGRDFAIITDRI